MHLLFDQDQTRQSCITTDVEYLEMPATDDIHMEDREHGLAWTKPNNGIYNTLNSQQTSRKNYVNFSHVIAHSAATHPGLLCDSRA